MARGSPPGGVSGVDFNVLGKLGVFFLGQACLDYPAAGRVVSFHGCEPPFMGGFFQAAQAAKGGLGVATPTRFPQDKMSD